MKNMLKRSIFILLLFSTLYARDAAILHEELILSDPPFSFCHASTLVETEKGLLVGYFGGEDEGSPDVPIYLSREQNGRWLSPEKVASARETPCWNPVFSKLADGELLLFYRAGKSPRSWSSFLMRSHGSGMRWSEPTILPAGVLGPIKNKPLLLDDGTLLCGTSVESYLAWGCWVDITQDGGASWVKSTPINVADQSNGIIQPTLFHSSGKTIRMLTRSKNIGYICTSTSDDKGRSWTAAIATKLPNPNSGIDAVRAKDGCIFLVYNHSQSSRTPLNVTLSKDGGKSWDSVLTLEEGPGSYSYPAIIQTRDGLLHITYSWNGSNIKHVVIDPSELKESRNPDQSISKAFISSNLSS
ncbi:MAG: hypothetical protein K1060chlam2_00124 [Chlamydiae bacterium]|nr:hypothetical protein [Chlamydiota bacterium]